LLLRLTECERLRLREAVRKREVLLLLVRARAVDRGQEIERHAARALVQELEEGVLRVRARLAPDYAARVVVDLRSLERRALAVRFHLELLQIGRQAMQPLVVRQYRLGLDAEEVAIPDG